MAVIVDQHGFPAHVEASYNRLSGGWPSSFYPQVNDSQYRSWRPSLDRSAASMLGQYKHRAMLSDARFIYTRDGAISGAVNTLANYAVGEAWLPRYIGKDKRFKELAEEQMFDWIRSPEIRGTKLNWHTILRIGSKSLDTDGDFFAVLTVDEAGNPRIQVVDATAVGSKWSGKIEPKHFGGRFVGMRCDSGVILDGLCRTVAYVFRSDDEKTETVVDAANVVQLIDTEWSDQVRGIPSLCKAILDWYDVSEIREAELIAQKANSSIALVEKNSSGTRPPSGVGIGPRYSAPEVVDMSKGLIRYIRSGEEISAHQSNRPGDAFHPFMAYVQRGAFAGMGLPYEFAFDGSSIGGAMARSMVSKVKRSIENRQRALRRFALSIALYPVATWIKTKQIPFTIDWHNWEFSMPPQYSVDVGRDANDRREDVALGIRTVSSIVEEDGFTIEEHFETRALDAVKAKAAADKHGVPVESVFNPSASTGKPFASEVDAEDDEEATPPKPKNPKDK